MKDCTVCGKEICQAERWAMNWCSLHTHTTAPYHHADGTDACLMSDGTIIGERNVQL